MLSPVKVVVLAGGTGGAKLAAGLQELIAADLTVVANTADDVEVHGLLVSPDPDLVTYWLAGIVDTERGWGLAGDTFAAHEQLVALGAPGWFQLSDRDLATCIYRTHFLAEGGTRVAAQGQIAGALGVSAAVLPMCEQRVTTRILTPAGWREIQEFLICDRGAAPIERVEVEGLDRAEPAPEVRAALAGADAIVIGPSNPVISIGPILAVPGMRETIAAAGAPVIAVSPFVAGRAVKGPTEAFMDAVGRPRSAAGVASLYMGLLDAIVVDDRDPDEPPADLRVLSCPTLMADASGRRALAGRVLELAGELAG